jgi:hypothetical protein
MLLIAPEDPQALSLGLFNSYQERKLEPLPIAVDIGKSNFTQPKKLGLYVERLVRCVLFFEGATYRV